MTESRNCANCKYYSLPATSDICCKCAENRTLGNTHPSWTPRDQSVSENNVDHPSHYVKGSLECIDVMVEVFGVEAVKHFCICNAFKYIWRQDLKNGLEDMKKALRYVEKYIKLSEKE